MPKKSKSQTEVKSADQLGETISSQQEPTLASRAMSYEYENTTYDLRTPKLLVDIEARALGSGRYPYSSRLALETYDRELRLLQIEFRKLQDHINKHNKRLVCVFEGRDAAGKGSTINRLMAYVNPRSARAVALSKPTEVERGQWYFQRYVNQLPTAGNIVLFDRSWYNRAGVERIMGFCTPDQLADFLREAPQLEGILVRDGVWLFKFYLEIGREMQIRRMHDRWHDPLKAWKVSDIDVAALKNYDAYSAAKEEMFRFTHTAQTPWTVILANDKRRTRLEAFRVVLSALDYAGKDKKAIGRIDSAIVGSGPEFLYRSGS